MKSGLRMAAEILGAVLLLIAVNEAWLSPKRVVEVVPVEMNMVPTFERPSSWRM